MDKNDNKKSMWDRLKSLWNTLPGFIRFIGTLLGIILALKALFPAAAMEISQFSASPEAIEPGDTSNLSWIVSEASNVTIEPGIGTVAPNGSLSVSPNQTTTYKLIASGKGGDKVSSCTVTVKNDSVPVLVDSFEASPDSIKAGENAVLNWHATGASNISIEPDIGIEEPAGTLSVSPGKTTTYKLTASNGNKNDIAYCTVTVENNLEPPEGNLTSPEDDLTTPQDNPPSTQITLTSLKSNPASTQDTPTSLKSNPAPTQATPTSLKSNPASTQATPTSLKNNPASTQVTSKYLKTNPAAPKENLTTQENLPTIDSFKADPDMINKGDSSKLTWSVSSATEVYIRPGIGTVGLTGSQRVFPDKNTTYTLTAANELGNVDATKVVFVKEPSSSSSKQTSPTPPSTPSLSTPKQLSPSNGAEFDNSSSGATLKWTAVSGVASYTVEIDTYDSNSDSWLSDSTESMVIPGITATSYSFEFPTEGSGRWRVWAAGSNGEESKKSGWWNFNYGDKMV